MVQKKARSLAPAKFDHKRVEDYHAESGSMSFFETRGARDSSQVFLFSDFDETFSMGNHTGHTSEEAYGSFFEAANYWLKEVGEKNFAEVAADAEKAQAGIRSAKQKEHVDRYTFQRWAFEVGMRHGFLSPAAIAADFLKASDYMHRLAKGNEQLLRAIYQFAEAWHWLQFEGKGEHELASIGLRSVEGRAKGPAVKQERANLKKEIVKSAYDQFAADNAKGNLRKNAKLAAGALIQDINKKLIDLGVRKMAEKSLIDELRPLIKERFARS